MQRGGRALGDGAGDHARAGATWLTGVHPKKTEGSDITAGISADQIAAKELGKVTQLGSLEIGLEEPNLAGGCVGLTNLIPDIEIRGLSALSCVRRGDFVRFVEPSFGRMSCAITSVERIPDKTPAPVQSN